MEKRAKKVKISNVLLLILIIIALILITVLGIKFYKRNENEKNIKEVVSQINENIEQKDTNEQIPYIDYQGYQVIGTIQIPKINIEYPILSETTKDSLNKSITRFGNGKVNEVGNLSLAGHNYINGSMFGKINELEIGDEIFILDLYGNKITYKIFDKYITDPNDTKVLESIEEDKKEVTLITCINRNVNRLIVKAREN